MLIDGAYNRWGSAKGVLILAAMRAAFRAVIADPIAEFLATLRA
ncbi:MAG TPA: hypothetical protein VHB98_20100 [Chloroflexota bacterium]|nr:hypothetical protein [Chloroflexota bacterium]